MSDCSICREPLMADQPGRHAVCAPLCTECGGSIDLKPYQGHHHRTGGECWPVVLAWIARRLQPPVPVRWWAPGLHDLEVDEFVPIGTPVVES